MIFDNYSPSKYSDKTVVKNYRYFNRGQYIKEIDDQLASLTVSLPASKKVKTKDFDKYFKNFEYHNALDAAIKSNNIENIASVIEELITRNALKLALLNRSPVKL